MKTHTIQQTKHELSRIISKHVYFLKKQGIVWDFSIVRISYRLRKKQHQMKKSKNHLKS